VAFVGLVVVPDSGRLFVGQSGTVTAQTFDRDHHLVTGVGVSWASSDTAVAQIVPYGDAVVGVLGKGPGTATIRASSGSAHASVSFKIRVIPVGSVQLVPDTSAAYAGTSRTLTATVIDTFGTTVTDRPITWTSSSPTLATVDENGVVSAHAAGTARIVASSEGKADTAALVILVRPTADWTAATDDWGTYQGNAAHTGYVPAVLDPGVFTLRWQRSIASAGFGLNQAAAGGGRVYVSTNAYFGTQLLVVLNAGTGAQIWHQDFGGIHSVDPPAFADGVVYVATGGHEDSFLRAYDAATGGQVFTAPYENQWSRWQAPVASGGKIYMAGGYYGGLYGFDGAGAQQWFNQIGQYEGFTPAVSNGRVYALTGEVAPQVLVMDAASGARVDSLTDPVLATASYAVGGTPVLGAAHDLLTVQNNTLLSFDLQGRTTAWRVGGSFVGQPSVTDAVVYAQNGLDVDARRESDGGLLWTWRRPAQAALWPAMIVTRNLLFATDGAQTYAVDLAAHLVVWTYPAGGELSLSADGLLLIGQTNGTLTAIGVK